MYETTWPWNLKNQGDGDSPKALMGRVCTYKKFSGENPSSQNSVDPQKLTALDPLGQEIMPVEFSPTNSPQPGNYHAAEEG